VEEGGDDLDCRGESGDDEIAEGGGEELRKEEDRMFDDDVVEGLARMVWVVGIGRVCADVERDVAAPSTDSDGSSEGAAGGGDRPRPEAAAPAAAVPAVNPAALRSVRGAPASLLFVGPVILRGADVAEVGVGITRLPASGAAGPEDEESFGISFDRVRPIFLEGV
jgi:hypothetical protein